MSNRIRRMSDRLARIVGGPRGRSASRLRRRVASLTAAALLVASGALAGDKPVKPRVFEATACQPVTLDGARALVCSAGKSTAVLRRWAEVEGDDGASWIVGWTR